MHSLYLLKQLKNKIKGSNWEKFETTEPQPKSTGSYKQKRVYDSHTTKWKESKNVKHIFTRNLDLWLKVIFRSV